MKLGDTTSPFCFLCIISFWLSHVYKVISFTSPSPKHHHFAMDYYDYSHRMEEHMRDRFEAMNRVFDDARREHERLLREAEYNPDLKVTTNTYSKTVTRSYNSDGNCGEEIVVERDTKTGKEVKTHSRRIGDRAVQTTTTRDLVNGDTVETTSRRNLLEADMHEFDREWATADVEYIEPTRHILQDHHHHHHQTPHLLQERPAWK